MLRFVPDRIFNSIADIDSELLVRENIKGLILDIDNTMAPRQVLLPDKALLDWIAGLKKADIKLFVLSNNRMDRVSKFAKALDLPFIRFGMKPLPRSFHRAVRMMELPKSEVAAVGDQIFTDITGAHLAGLRAWLVLPIDKRETLSFRLRRALEAPVIRKYNRGAERGGRR